tara:strand:+ start:119 stop:475 length:357 start_codon:yes stop_codon:yes gene_type:complete
MTTGKQALFEDYYRSLWLKQVVIDRKGNPLAREQSAHHKNGKFGGVRKNLKLSKQAEIVNRMLKEKMLGRQIAELLGITQQAVSDIKVRYGLPRSEEEVDGTQTNNEEDKDYGTDETI